MIAVSAIRQRIATAISTAMGASGWRESGDPLDVAGAGGDGEGRLHLGYAVGCPSTTALADRQRTSLGAFVETRVQVKAFYQLGAKKQITDYDAALDAEATMRLAIQAASPSDLHLRFEGTTRTVDDQGWMTMEQAWIALHRLSLE